MGWVDFARSNWLNMAPSYKGLCRVGGGGARGVDRELSINFQRILPRSMPDRLMRTNCIFVGACLRLFESSSAQKVQVFEVFFLFQYNLSRLQLTVTINVFFLQIAIV